MYIVSCQHWALWSHMLTAIKVTMEQFICWLFRMGSTNLQCTCYTLKLLNWEVSFQISAYKGYSFMCYINVYMHHLYLILFRNVLEFRADTKKACKNGGMCVRWMDGWMKAGWSCQSHLSSVSPHPSSPCRQQSSKQNSVCLPGNSYSLPAQRLLPPTTKQTCREWLVGERKSNKRKAKADTWVFS